MKRIWGIAKYPIALTLLWWVLQQVDTSQIVELFYQMPWHWALVALVAFGLAQLCAIWRMNLYYQMAGRPISFGYSFRLHYVALFYNIILPGGIGGDGYKVYLLNKQAAFPVKEGIKIQILTRLNGLLVLGLSQCLTLPFLPIDLPYRTELAVVVAVLGMLSYRLLVVRLFKADMKVEWRALPWSVGVQGLNILTMLALWHGIGGHGGDVVAIFLFQLAAVAGMIPITIGGLGIRELTFYAGGAWLHKLGDASMDAEAGVAVSLLVFGVTLAHALLGVVWMGRIRQMKPCEKQPRSA